jgi:hypothetical protein
MHVSPCVCALNGNTHQRHRHGEQHFSLGETEQQKYQVQALVVRVHLVEFRGAQEAGMRRNR